MSEVVATGPTTVRFGDGEPFPVHSVSLTVHHDDDERVVASAADLVPRGTLSWRMKLTRAGRRWIARPLSSRPAVKRNKRYGYGR